jgi:rhodanese-related sulfurtransferase
MNRVAVWCANLAVILGILAPCGASAQTQAPVGRASVEMLQPREAFALIQKNKGNPQFAIMDVRTPDEFAEGHVEGAINVNYNSGGFKTELSELDKKKTYLVYCRTGRRAGGAVQVMKDLGFTNIKRIQGDILKWQSEGLPLAK